jgi:hypothetical protein
MINGLSNSKPYTIIHEIPDVLSDLPYLSWFLFPIMMKKMPKITKNDASYAIKSDN